MDILSKAPYPGNVLSNFYPSSFTLDGIPCASMEGFLQSLKAKKPGVQRLVCALTGKDAKMRFHHRWENLRWKLTGKLYWNGAAYRRRSEEYQQLLDRAYDALFASSSEFREALAATGSEPLTHSIGKHDPRKTVLTEEEFITRLTRLRLRLSNNE